MPASQLVIGVPWYGREWPVFGAGTGERQREIRLTQPNLDPNMTAGEHTGLPLSVVEARNRSAHFGAIDDSWAAWDDTTKTPYYNWVGHWGQWGLGTYEDARSLGAKYEYAKSRAVGIGIWAIDYPMGMKSSGKHCSSCRPRLMTMPSPAACGRQRRLVTTRRTCAQPGPLRVTQWSTTPRTLRALA